MRLVALLLPCILLLPHVAAAPSTSIDDAGGDVRFMSSIESPLFQGPVEDPIVDGAMGMACSAPHLDLLAAAVTQDAASVTFSGSVVDLDGVLSCGATPAGAAWTSEPDDETYAYLAVGAFNADVTFAAYLVLEETSDLIHPFGLFLDTANDRHLAITDVSFARDGGSFTLRLPRSGMGVSLIDGGLDAYSLPVGGYELVAGSLLEADGPASSPLASQRLLLGDETGLSGWTLE